ncbi:hypothetical protein C2E21_8963 [Chlorella sorokiniana]|uniref:Uncharacterized protein n=1 Tax=Chlorella sorokiniana TaxID=3076 RepID=A0A2P6TCZ8_CHLSO|nr:hypothetical protein C2E21_8963 [Chlorella sorokiniana]|eukprot:PRW20508.1 hypothetical protein C2E21_8963 [Chlorella sorokiniana]
MELTVKLLAALPARAEGLGSVRHESPFRPKFSVQVSLLGPDGLTHIQRTKEFALKGKGGSGGGGAAGGSRPQPLGHHTLTFTLPSCPACSSRPTSSCGSNSGRSRLNSPTHSFTAGSGGGSGSTGCCEQAEGAATELRFGVLGKLSDMTTDVLMAQGSITLSDLPADGHPHSATIKMRRWCGATAGQPAGELAVELRLRPRRFGGSRRGGLARCPSGAASDTGLLSRSASGSSRGGGGSSSRLSYSASGPQDGTRRPLLSRLLAALQPACACTQVAPM